ncbi:MAG: hypothetical protein IT191_02960 [Microbacteriaceae bacterium]|nr:hypothetical protein [Microbacteriaceae bacterium]
MIDWFMWVEVAVSAVLGLLVLVFGIFGAKPNDYILGSALLVEFLLLAQLVIAILAPSFNNPILGAPLEFYTYLVSAIVVVPVAGFWALVERSKWGTFVIGVALLAIAVMCYRMFQIWNTPLL